VLIVNDIFLKLFSEKYGSTFNIYVWLSGVGVVVSFTFGGGVVIYIK